MPLRSGSDKATVSANIREMVASGHKQKQAVAAALHNADKSKAKGFAMGGAPMMGGLGSMQGLGGDMMGAFEGSKLGKTLMDSPLGGMFGGGGDGGGMGFRPPAGPGGAPAPSMPSIPTHFVPPQSFTPGTPPSNNMAQPMSPAMPGRAGGGAAPMPWFAKNEARSMVHTGPIASPVAGRTDHIPLRVPNGSYVFPADFVSHMGQNNTAAGHAKISRMFSGTGPFGSSLPKVTHGRGAPSAPAAPRPPAMTRTKQVFADGGKTHEGAAIGDDDGVDIMAAGGEHVLSPDQVRVVGEGNLDHGHKILDHYVMKVRKEHIKTLAKLPRPAQ